MKSLRAIVPCLLLLATARAAEIPREWLEGDNDLRARLEGLQDKPPPDLIGVSWLNSKPISFIKLQGQVVVVDFWTPWSATCMEFIPRNNAIYERYRERGLVWIGVCSTQGAPVYEKTLQERGIKYPVCLDDTNFSDMRFAVDGYPDYYIIDKRGVIVAADAHNDRIEDIVKRLIEEPYP